MIYKGKEITPGLERIERLMALLGHPEEAVRTIHIAGTNGKGSVGSFIVSILQEAGYRVGHFHTPALISTEDEIRINGQAISKEDLAAYEKKIAAAGEDSFFQEYGRPSPFETETAAAFLYFQEKKCDLAVIECGMGGRMDATNVIAHPAVSVLTQIGLDHMDYLGTSLSEIAAEKCGIIKSGCPVIALSGTEEVCDQIRQTADRKGCSLCFVKENAVRRISLDIEKGQVFDFEDLKGLQIQSPASYQLINAALAIKAVQELGDLKPDEASIRSGLSKMTWPARFEIIQTDPLIIYDGAHNPAAARQLRESVRQLIPDRDLILIMGVLADKNYQEILAILSETGSRLITFAPDSVRALPAQDLANAAQGLFESIYAAASLEQAWDQYEIWKSEMPENTAAIQCGTLSAYRDFCKVTEKYRK